MKKFMFIYMDAVQTDQPEPSAEEMQVIMKQWWDWLGSGQADGWVVNMGDPLEPQERRINSEMTVTDGPLAEAKEIVGGYSVVQAVDIDAAVELAKGCPIYHSGGSVVVRPIADFVMPE